MRQFLLFIATVMVIGSVLYGTVVLTERVGKNSELEFYKTLQERQVETIDSLEVQNEELYKKYTDSVLEEARCQLDYNRGTVKLSKRFMQMYSECQQANIDMANEARCADCKSYPRQEDTMSLPARIKFTPWSKLDTSKILYINNQ